MIPSYSGKRLHPLFARLLGETTFNHRGHALLGTLSWDETERLGMRARQGEMGQGDLSSNAEYYRHLVMRWANARNQLKPAQNILRYVERSTRLLLHLPYGAKCLRLLHKSGKPNAEEEANHPGRQGTCASTENSGAYYLYRHAQDRCRCGVGDSRAAPNAGCLSRNPRPIVQHGRSTRVLRLSFLDDHSPARPCLMSSHDCSRLTTKGGKATDRLLVAWQSRYYVYCVQYMRTGRIIADSGGHA